MLTRNHARTNNTKLFHFAGITNTQNETELFSLAANDDTKGALVIRYSLVHKKNVNLIREIKLIHSIIAFLRLKALKQVFLFFVAVFYS